MDFTLRCVRIFPGVNSRAELVTLAPGLRPERRFAPLARGIKCPMIRRLYTNEPLSYIPYNEQPTSWDIPHNEQPTSWEHYLDRIQRNLDAIMIRQPNALVLITGDFNPTSTWFKSKDIAQVSHLKQLVTFKTRDSGILDWLFTNRPKLFNVTQLPKIWSSDHYTILAQPVTTTENKPVITKTRNTCMQQPSPN